MTQKITELTPEQQAKMPEYVDKWIKIGTNTDRLDPARTRKTIDGFRKLINMAVDVPLLIVKNPIEGWVASSLALQGVEYEDINDEMKLVFNGNIKNRNIPKATMPWQTGSFFAASFSFYDYMLEVVGVEFTAELWAKYKTWEATCELGCIYPLVNMTIVSEKPLEIHLNETNVLHCDGRPALVYDGLGDFVIHSLNGVRVPQWLAETDAEALQLDQYHSIDNADVRAEFVRKVGIERFLDSGTLIDCYSNYDVNTHDWWHKSSYELYDMSSMFEGLDYAPYLKMTNQTTGIYHMEGVSPKCRTVGDALKERFGGRDFVISAIA
jgi:hypothetical protein